MRFGFPFLLLVLAACSSAPAATAAPPPPGADTLCPAPFIALTSGSCLALPPDAAADTPVAIFLHGKTDVRGTVLFHTLALAEAARDAGVALLVPFGKRGQCAWSAEDAAYICWPTMAAQQAELRGLVGELARDLDEVATRVSAKSRPVPDLIGFSNGGFAASRLAAETDMELRSLAILLAGGTPPISFPLARELPTLLLAARGDTWHFPTMERLREQLAGDGWSPTWLEREGGHEITAGDVGAVLRFLGERGASAAR